MKYERWTEVSKTIKFLKVCENSFLCSAPWNNSSLQHIVFLTYSVTYFLKLVLPPFWLCISDHGSLLKQRRQCLRYISPHVYTCKQMNAYMHRQKYGGEVCTYVHTATQNQKKNF